MVGVNMEMPSCCARCDFCIEDKYADMRCALLGSEWEETDYNGDHRDDKCPLVEIEQSEDCVSRQVVLNLMQLKMGGNELYKAVYELPPVIPTHKTCKECKEWINDKKYPRCRDFGVALNEDFYCADFKRKE